MITVFTLLVMLRLSTMSRPILLETTPSRYWASRESSVARAILFASVCGMVSLGYFVQPVLEKWIFGASFVSTSEEFASLRRLGGGVAPGSIIGYLVVKSVGQSHLVGSYLSSILILGGFDFFGVLRGDISIPQFWFCLLCNVIGGPIGVFLGVKCFRVFNKL